MRLTMYRWFIFALMLVFFLNASESLPSVRAAGIALRNPSWIDFGWSRRWANDHTAIDFLTSTRPLAAAADGTVTFAGSEDQSAYCTFFYTPHLIQFKIQHGDGFLTGYAHLSQIGINPRTGVVWQTGDRIFAGEIVGNSGHTGCTSNGSGGPADHLHFWVEQHGVTLNPDNPLLWTTFYPDSGSIDIPENNSQVSSITRISGWAKVSRKFNTAVWRYEPSSEGAISNVEIWLLEANGPNPNPIKLGDAVYGIAQPSSGGNYGWYFDWNTATVPNGTYFLQPRAVARDGASSVLQGGQSGSIKIHIKNSQQLDYNGDGKPDLYAIAKTGGGSRKTDLYILDGAKAYKEYLFGGATTLDYTDDPAWAFNVADYNNDGTPDLYAIAKTGGGSRKTDLYILDGAKAYKEYLFGGATTLDYTGSDNTWAFNVADYNNDGIPDLYAIAKTGGGSRKTDLYILDGAKAYKEYLFGGATTLDYTGSDNTWAFNVADYNNDGIPDLYAIAKTGGGSRKTDLYILDGAKAYKEYLFGGATTLDYTGSDNTWAFNVADYNNDGIPDLYAIAKTGGGSRKTDLYILDGTKAYNEYLFGGATILDYTSPLCSWDFATGTSCTSTTTAPTNTPTSIAPPASPTPTQGIITRQSIYLPIVR